ncbi:MAG: FtsX-like permease family protein [Terriglobia bacterium]|nr:FtsX-like permease family protein [Terriglobia bacterium]
MNKLVISNLVHRPLRSAISVIAIAIEVTLILLIVGLSIGTLNDAAERQKGIGADIMVSPPGSSFMLGLSSSPMPMKIADVLRKVNHVTAVAPVAMQSNTSGAVEIIDGIVLDQNSPNDFNKIGAPFKFLAGGPFQGPYDMLVDDFVANQRNIHVGDKQELMNHEFTVSGVVYHGKGARKFIPLSTLQDLTGSVGKVSMFYVKVDDPKLAPEVVQAIKQIPGMQNYGVRTMAEYMSMMTVQNLPGLAIFIDIVIGISMVIGFLVIFQSMYTAVMERTREIGILKSLGANKMYIINVILRETLVLSIVGIGLGFLISYLAAMGIRHKFPLQTILMTAAWAGRAAVIAMIGALLGAIYPAFKAAQKDPIDALAYE